MNQTQADKQKCLDAIRKHGKDAIVELEVRTITGGREMRQFKATAMLAFIERSEHEWQEVEGM
jgi:hypothetical protein